MFRKNCIFVELSGICFKWVLLPKWRPQFINTKLRLILCILFACRWVQQFNPCCLRSQVSMEYISVKFQWKLGKIYFFSFSKMPLKLFSSKCRSFCSEFNVLTTAVSIAFEQVIMICANYHLTACFCVPSHQKNMYTNPVSTMFTKSWLFNTVCQPLMQLGV